MHVFIVPKPSFDLKQAENTKFLQNKKKKICHVPADLKIKVKISATKKYNEKNKKIFKTSALPSN